MNVILIGMPASGKSAVGRCLAARMGYAFADGDDVIRARTKMTLPELMNAVGTEGFLKAEEEALLSLSVQNTVIAPGGSAVYSDRAMAHLTALGKIVYLRVPISVIEARIPDFTARGVVMRGSVRTLRALYGERTPLYERYAELTVDPMDGCDEAAEQIMKLL